jgi:transaldolase
MTPTSLDKLRIKLFADGANREAVLALYADPRIQGITTNPTLMAKAGIKDYEAFFRNLLETVTEKPLSIEVFADEFDEMEVQARMVATWGDNVFVKIPITNTKAQSAVALVKKLAGDGIKLNITAITLPAQVADLVSSLNPEVPSVISIFAGRIADTGRDPVPLMKEVLDLASGLGKAEVLWASVREVLNIVQAEESGCHIVTVPLDLLTKAFAWFDKPLDTVSLETVEMFYQDAARSGYRLTPV